MEFMEFERLFEASLSQNGLLLLDAEKKERFHLFSEFLLAFNQHTNLTAIRNMSDVITKHLVDSLLAAEYLPEGARVLDLGCGPGFPSIPLAIARPDLEIVALDSTAKKIAFVDESIKRLGLSNLSAVAGRAEDVSVSRKIGKFDVVVSRAVARMNVLSELCLPYVKKNGVFLALKAAKAEEETAEAENAIRTLGGSAAILHTKKLALLEGEPEERCLVEVKKVKETPATYPRAYAAILKKPL